MHWCYSVEKSGLSCSVLSVDFFNTLLQRPCHGWDSSFALIPSARGTANSNFHFSIGNCQCKFESAEQCHFKWWYFKVTTACTVCTTKNLNATILIVSTYRIQSRLLFCHSSFSVCVIFLIQGKQSYISRHNCFESHHLWPVACRATDRIDLLPVSSKVSNPVRPSNPSESAHIPVMVGFICGLAVELGDDNRPDRKCRMIRSPFAGLAVPFIAARWWEVVGDDFNQVFWEFRYLVVWHISDILIVIATGHC